MQSKLDAIYALGTDDSVMKNMQLDTLADDMGSKLRNNQTKN
jgi:hypothetical protein